MFPTRRLRASIQTKTDAARPRERALVALHLGHRSHRQHGDQAGETAETVDDVQTAQAADERPLHLKELGGSRRRSRMRHTETVRSPVSLKYLHAKVSVRRGPGR